MPDDRSIQPRRTPNETASPRRYTVAPHVHTSIAIKALPHAVCSVHAEGDYDPKHSLKVYADGEGVVRFHVQPSAVAQEIARLEVDCTMDGNLVRYPLHLRVDVDPSAEMPAPPAEKSLAQRYDRHTRPALTVDEAMRLTDRPIRPLFP